MADQLDMKEYDEKRKLLDKYRLGETYYYINDNKIKEGTIKQVSFESYLNALSGVIAKFEIKVSNEGGSNISFTPEKLFDTKKDAAEQFLKDNDVPSELLRNIVLPDEMLFKSNGEEYARVVLKQEVTTDTNFWDCKCERYYVHSINHDACPVCKARRENCPPSRINEIEDNRYSLRNKHD